MAKQIDKVKALARCECKRHLAQRPLVGVDNETGHVRILYTTCKQWDCPPCAARRTLQHRARIIHGIRELKDEQERTVWFATFTLRQVSRDIERAVKWFGSSWNRFNTDAKRWCRKNGLYFCYALVVELSNKGRLHAHAFVTGIGHKPRWNDSLSKAGLGYIYDLQQIDNPGIAGWYATKYLTKSLAGVELPSRTRRVRYSGNFPAKHGAPQTAIVWQRVGDEKEFRYLLDNFSRQGYIIDFPDVSYYTMFDSSSID